MTGQQIRKKYIGDRAFYQKVLFIVIPIIIQNAITNFVGLLDNIMVGQVGTDQMNGVAIVNQLLFVFNLCVWGALSGAGIFTAQYYGKGDHEGVRNTFRAKLVLTSVVAVVGIVLFLTKGEWLIIRFLHETDGVGNAENTLYYGRAYLHVMLIGLIPFVISQAYANTLRDVGETVLPMKAGIAAVVVNVVLNYILIFGHFGAPRLGVVGAAAATVVSRFVEMAIVVIWTQTHKEKHPFIVGAFSSLRIPPQLMRQILIKGAPLAFNEGLWALGVTMLNQNYSMRGLSVIAALNISSTISNLFSVVYLAMGDAIAIIVGQLLGAQKMEEAKDTDRKMICFSVLCCLVIGFTMSLFRNLFPAIYKTEPQVRSLAADFILITSVMMPFHAFLHGCYFTLRTGGKTIVTFLFDSVFMWALAVPCAYLLTHFTALPILALYAVVQSLDFIKCIVGAVFVKKGVWLQNIVREI
ncbi:MAG: MATE family efflux transporter [Lachnospiraceae bacterium]|nr:MATE family efflux transporter [Lachnospiraceae bacterium]MBD5483769.1 MATE family efflux transporter [Lachnospiraceae bacterium]